MRPLDKLSATPRVVQITVSVRDAIAAGELELGRPIPTRKELAQFFGVATATVNDALGVLRTEGVLVGQPGARTVVARLPDDRPTRDLAAEVDALTARVDALEQRCQCGARGQLGG